MGGVDSKAKYTEQLALLQKEPINTKDDTMWKVLFTTPVQFQDVCEILSPADIRKIREKQPFNLGTLIFKVLILIFNSFQKFCHF